MKVQRVLLQALKGLATLKNSILNLPNLYSHGISMNSHDAPAKTPHMTSRSVQDPILYPAWAQGTTGCTAVHSISSQSQKRRGGGAGAAAFSWELTPTRPRLSTRWPARSPGQHPAAGKRDESSLNTPELPFPFPVSLRRAQPLGDPPPKQLMKGRPVLCLGPWPIYWNRRHRYIVQMSLW